MLENSTNMGARALAEKKNKATELGMRRPSGKDKIEQAGNTPTNVPCEAQSLDVGTGRRIGALLPRTEHLDDG
jgi:hypothetical protein